MARLTKPLTNTEIEKSKPKEKDYTLSDGQGLYLLVKVNGGKFWRFNYLQPFTKKRILLGLGKYPEISLAQVRAIRADYQALLAKGIDPQVYRKQKEQEAANAANNTFIYIAEQWKAKKAQEVQPLTLAKNWARLEKHLFYKIEHLPITEITPQLIKSILNPMNTQGISETLRRVIRLLNEIMRYAVNSGYIEINRCADLGEAFSYKTPENNPTIRPDELPQFLTALLTYNLSPATKLLIQWQLLTMTRPSEAVNAEWAEIDLVNRLWTIPAEKMKMSNAHIIPLSTQAVRVLEKVKELCFSDRFVFPSNISADKPMNRQTANRAISLIGYKGKLTAHGLRSIASTYLNEYEPMINYDVIEACLSHKIKDQVRKAYNRSDYLEQRKPVMQLWGDYVEECSKVSIFA